MKSLRRRIRFLSYRSWHKKIPIKMRDNFDPVIESLVLEVKTRQIVADEYGTSVKTLIRSLLKKGIVLPPGQIFPDTCKIIYYALGIPAGLKTKLKAKKDVES